MLGYVVGFIGLFPLTVTVTTRGKRNQLLGGRMTQGLYLNPKSPL